MSAKKEVRREFEVAGIHKRISIHEEREARPKNKYSRREAIKYGAKIGVGAALWGTVGNLVGQAYDLTVRPVADKVEKTYERVRRFNPFRRGEPEGVTRRGFLRSLLGQAHEHPVATGTTIGAVYGGGKYALSGLSKYLTNNQIARLKDENADYKERIHLLEEYKGYLEEDMKKRDAKVDQLQEELVNVRGIIGQLNKTNKLEKVVEEPEPPKTLLIVGLAGLLVSIIISSVSLTGNSILNMNSQLANVLGASVFVISLILVLLGRKN